MSRGWSLINEVTIAAVAAFAAARLGDGDRAGPLVQRIPRM
jgi:hypothetical protein